jgi:transcriptional regulator with XRE-family HTH domain
MSDEEFGDLVEERRTAAGLSREELGELVGRSPTTIYDWEHGKSVPRQGAVFEALAVALAVSEEQLRAAATSEQGNVDRAIHPAPPSVTPEIEPAGGAASLRRPLRYPAAFSGPPAPLSSYRHDRRQMVTYWIRGVLTAAALIALFVVFVWAFGALAQNVGAVLDVFGG